MFAPLLLPPKATLVAPPVSVKRGGSVSASATARLPEGFHAYQNPPKNEVEFPLAVKASSPKGLTSGGFAYPIGVAMKAAGVDSLVYEGEVKVAFRVTAGKATKPGEYRVPLTLSYQLCTETMCLPPATATATLRVKVTNR